ncbi:swr1 complex snf2 family dna-dependent atpase [Pelomyxa schiedti]|nr:swr1 complex snf2 family dna-dependent atpase [Pelomyxa schiedti]
MSGDEKSPNEQRPKETDPSAGVGKCDDRETMSIGADSPEENITTKPSDVAHEDLPSSERTVNSVAADGGSQQQQNQQHKQRSEPISKLRRKVAIAKRLVADEVRSSRQSEFREMAFLHDGGCILKFDRNREVTVQRVMRAANSILQQAQDPNRAHQDSRITHSDSDEDSDDEEEEVSGRKGKSLDAKSRYYEISEDDEENDHGAESDENGDESDSEEEKKIHKHSHVRTEGGKVREKDGKRKEPVVDKNRHWKLKAPLRKLVDVVAVKREKKDSTRRDRRQTGKKVNQKLIKSSIGKHSLDFDSPSESDTTSHTSDISSNSDSDTSSRSSSSSTSSDSSRAYRGRHTQAKKKGGRDRGGDTDNSDDRSSTSSGGESSSSSSYDEHPNKKKSTNKHPATAKTTNMKSPSKKGVRDVDNNQNTPLHPKKASLHSKASVVAPDPPSEACVPWPADLVEAAASETDPIFAAPNILKTSVPFASSEEKEKGGDSHWKVSVKVSLDGICWDSKAKNDSPCVISDDDVIFQDTNSPSVVLDEIETTGNELFSTLSLEQPEEAVSPPVPSLSPGTSPSSSPPTSPPPPDTHILKHSPALNPTVPDAPIAERAPMHDAPVGLQIHEQLPSPPQQLSPLPPPKSTSPQLQASPQSPYPPSPECIEQKLHTLEPNAPSIISTSAPVPTSRIFNPVVLVNEQQRSPFTTIQTLIQPKTPPKDSHWRPIQPQVSCLQSRHEPLSSSLPVPHSLCLPRSSPKPSQPSPLRFPFVLPKKQSQVMSQSTPQPTPQPIPQPVSQPTHKLSLLEKLSATLTPSVPIGAPQASPQSSPSLKLRLHVPQAPELPKFPQLPVSLPSISPTESSSQPLSSPLTVVPPRESNKSHKHIHAASTSKHSHTRSSKHKKVHHTKSVNKEIALDSTIISSIGLHDSGSDLVPTITPPPLPLVGVQDSGVPPILPLHAALLSILTPVLTPPPPISTTSFPSTVPSLTPDPSLQIPTPVSHKECSTVSSTTSPPLSPSSPNALLLSPTVGQVSAEAAGEERTLQRINELKRQGLWGSARTPKAVEPPKKHTLWDSVLTAISSAAKDSRARRKEGLANAKKVAKLMEKHVKNEKSKVVRAEKEQEQQLKKVASKMARMVKIFWGEMEKVVMYKHKARINERKSEAMNKHLDFVVGQTERLSQLLAQDLTHVESDKSHESRTTATNPQPELQENNNELLPSSISSMDREESHQDTPPESSSLAPPSCSSPSTSTTSTTATTSSGKKLIEQTAALASSAQPTGITLTTTQVKTPVPFLLKHTLREYQHIGLNWLVAMYEKRLNGILADEMGLGKTIMTISLLAHIACEKGIWGPHLIIVPSSTMLNWELELKKWCPAFKVLTYYGSQKERKNKRQGWSKQNAFHVCISSYKLVTQDHSMFRRKQWVYMILDEAQNIKNFRSQRWQTLLNFNTRRRLLLTGTPLQNSLIELWSLMHFLMPDIFQSHKEFREWFVNPVNNMMEESSVNDELIARLHGVLRPFLLRRMKKDVEKQLPRKFQHIVPCTLSRRQQFLYDEFIESSTTQGTLTSGSFFGIMNVLMQLRKVCNHPDLFEPRSVDSSFCLEPLCFRLPALVTQLTEENCGVRNSGLPLLDGMTLPALELSGKSVVPMLLSTSSAADSDVLPFIHIPITKGIHDSQQDSALNKWIPLPQVRPSPLSSSYFAHLCSLRSCITQPIFGATLVKSLQCLTPADLLFHPPAQQQIPPLVTNLPEHIKACLSRFSRWCCVIPPVCTKQPQIHISHEVPSHSTKQEHAELHALHLLENSSLTTIFHPFAQRSRMIFPDKWLLQYDCGKLRALSVLLHSLKRDGHKALIFTQMTKMLDILEAFVNLHSYTYVRLDGATKIERRQLLVEQFNRNPKIFLFLLSTRSGGFGVNLTGADTVIFYDTDWNPAMDAQAQDRCHRIGQTREVHIYRLVTQYTIEENILRKARQKKTLSRIVIKDGGFNTQFFEDLDLSSLLKTQNNSETERVVIPAPSSTELEAAFSKVEEEEDMRALKQVQKEQASELEEFIEGPAVEESQDTPAEAGEEHEDPGLAPPQPKRSRPNASSHLRGVKPVSLPPTTSTISISLPPQLPITSTSAPDEDVVAEIEALRSPPAPTSLDEELSILQRYAVHYLEKVIVLVDEKSADRAVQLTEEELQRQDKQLELSTLKRLHNEFSDEDDTPKSRKRPRKSCNSKASGKKATTKQRNGGDDSAEDDDVPGTNNLSEKSSDDSGNESSAASASTSHTKTTSRKRKKPRTDDESSPDSPASTPTSTTPPPPPQSEGSTPRKHGPEPPQSPNFPPPIPQSKYKPKRKKAATKKGKKKRDPSQTKGKRGRPKGSFKKTSHHAKPKEDTGPTNPPPAPSPNSQT